MYPGVDLIPRKHEGSIRINAMGAHEYVRLGFDMTVSEPRGAVFQSVRDGRSKVLMTSLSCGMFKEGKQCLVLAQAFCCLRCLGSLAQSVAMCQPRPFCEHSRCTRGSAENRNYVV